MESKVIDAERLFREKAKEDQREKCESFFNAFIKENLGIELYQSLKEVFIHEHGMGKDLSEEEGERIKNQVDKLMNRVIFYWNCSLEMFLPAYPHFFDEHFEEFLKDVESQLERDVELQGHIDFILDLCRSSYASLEANKSEQRSTEENTSPFRKNK